MLRTYKSLPKKWKGKDPKQVLKDPKFLDWLMKDVETGLKKMLKLK